MARKKTASESASDESRAMEQRVVAFAEQLGRKVGTVERKTTGWLDMAALSDQVTRIRDGAADLLSHLGRDGARHEQPIEGEPDNPTPDNGPRTASREAGKVGGRKRASPRPAAKPRVASPGRSRQQVAAPGKAHRKPPTTVAGAKHSNESAKALVTDSNRRTRRR
jgi:hypothetical protein